MTARAACQLTDHHAEQPVGRHVSERPGVETHCRVVTSHDKPAERDTGRLQRFARRAGWRCTIGPGVAGKRGHPLNHPSVAGGVRSPIGSPAPGLIRQFEHDDLADPQPTDPGAPDKHPVTRQVGREHADTGHGDDRNPPPRDPADGGESGEHAAENRCECHRLVALTRARDVPRTAVAGATRYATSSQRIRNIAQTRPAATATAKEPAVTLCADG
jgi:hypothetical protein